MTRTIAIVVGTRPEVIKMVPVYLALRERQGWTPLLVSTGQHRQMLDQACAAFELKPDIDLGLMQAGQDLPGLTARVLTATAELFQRHRPEAVLVQGDTTTVLGTALGAFYHRLPVGHVEAGLRTYNFEAPWPEEMNRRLVDPLCRWCFAPTESSRQNLLGERIPGERVHVTGNTVIDALLWMRARLRRQPESAVGLAGRCGIDAEFQARFLPANPGALSPHRLVLVTGHRRESFGEGFEGICQGIRQLAERHPDVGVLYPVHLNPNVQEPVRRLLGGHPRIHLIKPTDYASFVWLMDRAYFILSDSGGVQEEAPSLGKPVLVMRETTERPEGTQAGTCRLVGTDPARIYAEARRLLEDPEEYRRRSQLANPYGDGQAAQRIVAVLSRELGQPG